MLIARKSLLEPSQRVLRRRTTFTETELSLDQRVALILQEIEDEAGTLDDPELAELWLDAVQTFKNGGDISKLADICKWRRKLVPIDEFMFGSAYLAQERDQIYLPVIEACEALDSGAYVEAVLTGAIGTGKSTIANIMLAREIYKVSCLRHPQETFGVKARSSLVFTIQSVRFSTAKKAIFEEFGNGYIHQSPYFKTIYKYDHRRLSEMVWPENNVRIMPVTSSHTGAISMNVVGGILDEVNYMQKIEKSQSSNANEKGEFEQAKMLYNTIARRRKSRFNLQGKLPGILFVISSSRFPDDFTEEKAKESEMEGGTDKTIYVYRKALWDAKPRHTMLEETFRVQIGTETVRSRILAPDEKAPESIKTVTIPMDYFNEFQKDCDGALRDFAGRTTLATKPFITRREAIHEAMRLGEQHKFVNIFQNFEYDLSLGIPKPIPERIRYDVPMYRMAHLDLGLKKDACGLSIGHVTGTKVQNAVNPHTGVHEFSIMPVVALDCVMRIVPPPGGEVEFELVRELLIMLRDEYDMNIEFITFDGFQSADSRQILRRRGFKTDYLSVEKIEAYRTLRDALYDGRVILPKCPMLAKELAELELVLEGQKDKVDHRVGGSKDVADSACGVVSFLMKRRSAWLGMPNSTNVGLHLLGDLGGNSKRADDTGRIVVPPVASGRARTIRKRVERKRVVRRSVNEVRGNADPAKVEN
jgi:hypothetical protein